MKNKTAKVKVKLFGQELEQFGITSDDKTIKLENNLYSIKDILNGVAGVAVEDKKQYLLEYCQTQLNNSNLSQDNLYDYYLCEVASDLTIASLSKEATKRA